MKYLELIKGQFTADHEARAKQQEPYVAYSEEAGGVMYTFIPEPVVGPGDNEIWCTVNSELICMPRALYFFNYDYDESARKYIISSISDDKITTLNALAYGTNLEEYPDLMTLYLPKSLEIINWRVLSSSNNLSEIYFNGDKDSWNKVKKVDIELTNNIKATVVHCIDGDISVYDRTNEYFPPAPEGGL